MAKLKELTKMEGCGGVVDRNRTFVLITENALGNS